MKPRIGWIAAASLLILSNSIPTILNINPRISWQYEDRQVNSGQVIKATLKVNKGRLLKWGDLYIACQLPDYSLRSYPDWCSAVRPVIKNWKIEDSYLTVFYSIPTTATPGKYYLLALVTKPGTKIPETRVTAFTPIYVSNGCLEIR